MPLTLETGAGLPNADSFVSLAEVRAYATSRGKTVSAVDLTLEAQVRIAHDYLLVLESRMKGWRRTDGQALPYPRSGVAVYGRGLTEGTIPVHLKQAVCQLVLEQAEFPALQPSGDGRIITQETIGPISTTYSSAGTTAQPEFPRVRALLEPLLVDGFRLRAVRG